ncbi:D-glycerate dehydrogenase [Candidatus Microgenomates bacterium]|nr:D-glycerate dehydrogenase [Candidatus Microgenomates bacterium]
MKVVVSRKIPGPAVDLLQQQGYEVVIGADFSGADAILSLLTDKITGEVMDAAGKQLKIIANYAVGFDNVDLEAAKQRNIFVTNTPGGFEASVAEHAIGLLIAVARKIVSGDAYVRAGKYIRWEPELFLGTELAKKTIGIIGMGRIGSVVARIAGAGLGMKVIYHSHGKENIDAEFVDNLDDLLAKADVVTIHVPLNDETRHMISKKELSGMKKNAILINTSRGAIVDEEALCEALSNNWIAGAGLDVFEDETPIVSPTEKILHSLSNVVLTPHIGSATVEARAEMSRTAAANIIAALSGQTPPNLAK